MKLSTLKATAAAVRKDDGKGIWVDDIPNMPGLRLRVRLFGTDDDKRIQREAADALPMSRRLRGKIEQADQDAIMVKRLHGAILTDWDGLEGDDSQPVVFTADAALELLSDPELQAFRDAVIWAATLASAEAAEREQAARKN